MRFKTQKA